MAAISRIGKFPTARVRYEDFVADPAATLAAATAELGVPLTARDLPAVSNGGVNLGPSHGLSGNPARFRSGALAIRRDDRWVTGMPAMDRAVVTALTLPLLLAYGYPAVPGTRSVRVRPGRETMRSTT
jgi:hypothetical protein